MVGEKPDKWKISNEGGGGMKDLLKCCVLSGVGHMSEYIVKDDAKAH